MQCPHCNQVHPDDIRFCPVTGKQISHQENVCLKCGQPVDPNLLFCTHCGYKQTRTQPDNPPVEPERVIAPVEPGETVAPPIAAALPVASKPTKHYGRACLFLGAGGVGLALILVAIIASALKNPNPANVVPPVVWTATSTFTPEPSSTPTPEPSFTPTLEPTSTSMATQAPVSICLQGSVRLVGRGVDMCLPVSWEGGSDERLDSVITLLKTMGSTGQQIGNLLDSTRSTTIFWAFDTQEASIATNVNVGNDPASMPVSQFMSGECQELPAYYQQQIGGTAACLEEGVVSIGNYTDIGRVVIEETISGTDMKAIQYLVKQGDVFWEITFTTDPDRYSEALPIFEAAIASMNINPQ